MTAPTGPVPEDNATPAVRAAQRDAQRQAPRPNARAYGLPTDSRDAEALGAELAAAHALVHAESPEEVANVIATLVHDLGGALVPARYADPATVPLDVSLGLSEPMLAYAEPVSLAAMRLGVVLPGFVESARLVLQRLHGELRRCEEYQAKSSGQNHTVVAAPNDVGSAGD